MAKQVSTPEVTIFKTQRRVKVGYVVICHTNLNTKAPTRSSQSPSLQLKGEWLREVGFDTGTGVTVRISQGGIVPIADCTDCRRQSRR